MLKTNIPPWEKAWGRDSVPAPTHVVRRMKMEETTVPLVAALHRPFSLSKGPGGPLSITGAGEERAECTTSIVHKLQVFQYSLAWMDLLLWRSHTPQRQIKKRRQGKPPLHPPKIDGCGLGRILLPFVGRL